jgi:catechol 2,3-dioxygenase-like lactoylglutathione lyase family enzyme
MAEPDMVGMVVSDMAAALRFYRLLGLEIPPERDAETHVECVLPGGFRIGWDSQDAIRESEPEWANPAGQRLTLAFKCEDPAAVDALCERVLEHGYAGHKAPWDAFWGQRYAVVVDPDGNRVELFAAL